jgi:hypothetical protein
MTTAIIARPVQSQAAQLHLSRTAVNQDAQGPSRGEKDAEGCSCERAAEG